MRMFFENMLGISSDFDWGFFIGFFTPIILFVLAVIIINLFIWFSELNKMRKEYIDKKNKKLYNQSRK